MFARMPQYAASTSAYLALSRARCTDPVVVHFICTPSFRPSSFFFLHWYGFQVVISSVHRLSRILMTCPAQVHFLLLTYSIMSVTFNFSLTQMFFLSLNVMFNILLSIFVCAAASLFFAWVVSSMFPRRMSLLEVRMICRLFSASMFQCYL